LNGILKIRERKLSSQEVVKKHIERIRAVNPKINAAVAYRFLEAIQEAELADSLIQSGDFNPLQTPFLGVPCSIKEAFALKGMPNTSGFLPSFLSLLFLGFEHVDF